MEKHKAALSPYFFLLPLCVLLSQVSCGKDMREEIQPPEDAPVEAAATIEGKQYELIQGAVYEVDPKSGRRKFAKRLYKPGFYEENYQTIDGTIYRINTGGGKKFAVRKSISDGFEKAKTLHDLIGPEYEWTSLTLMGPRSPTVPDFVKLRQRILSRQSGFLDNRIEPTAERSHNGKQALRLYAVPPSQKMQLTKASLDSEILHFIKGDHFWFSGWFFLEQGRPTSIMDLECSYIEHSPGMRILFTEEMRPYLELKWMAKPTYKPRQSTNVVFPRSRWVHVKVHLLLSVEDDGEAELWLDGQKVIEGKGQTLPIPGAVYDRLQVGITANPKGTTTVLYVDDVTVSDIPLE